MILFCDDEPFMSDTYVDALVRAGFAVELVSLTTEALPRFREKVNTIELAIVDIMASVKPPYPPEVDLSRVEGGLRTGEEILRLMNATAEGRRVPKLILTNISNIDFYRVYENNLAIRGCYRKPETLPSELVGIVRRILGR